ncbi:ORC CDC6 like AAA+ ATpase [Cryptosporidium bovis]|uniref:ORC CDC6 like AAA+ ATpase n=1 Tax=Cryptosporidium bovis TaxID=310047 RepID=UPI00351A350F|nr:ORC CDC6 like AAA+ ATpase [Cryptosporidium bovis]
MSLIERKITTSELRLNAKQKLNSLRLTKNEIQNKSFRKRSERRILLNTEYINGYLESLSVNEYDNKEISSLKNTRTKSVSTGRRKKIENKINNINSIFFKKEISFKKSPIVTPQGYHLYLYHIIETNTETDIFTVGDHVMICLSDGGERPAQITAFLYDPEKDLQGVEVRWFYSEDDILDLGKMVDKSKIPKDLFSFEEEYLESDKCEVLEVTVIKRMIRIWNSKSKYLKWTKDELDIYSGPQVYGRASVVKKGRKKVKINSDINNAYHDEYLIEYIKEFNEDLPSFSIELSDNFMALYILLVNTGTVVPILGNRNKSHFLSKCSNYYNYYVKFFNQINVNNISVSNNNASNLRQNYINNNLHWSERPGKALPCREKEYDEIKTTLETSILSEGGGVLFIAGLPGTGKTATVLNVLRTLETEINVIKNSDEMKKHILVCYINALHLSNPDHFYTVFLQELTGSSTWAPSKETCYNSIDSFLKDKESPITILVIDEIDWLQKINGSGTFLNTHGGCRGNSTNSSNIASYTTVSGSENSGTSLLYTLFDWPFQKNSKLVIIAISNTMDLPEKLIPRCTSRCGYARINFSPFSVNDMIKILESRLGILNENEDGNNKSVFCSKAIEFCARRIAQQSSDVRRALQVLHRALEICKIEEKQAIKEQIGDNDNENDNNYSNECLSLYSKTNEKVTKQIQVQIFHVQTAFKEVLLGDSTLIIVSTLPLLSKIFLVSIILEHEKKLNQANEIKNNRSNDKLMNNHPYQNNTSLFEVLKRFKTILSLIRYSNQEYVGNTTIKRITRSLITTRIIQVFKGYDYSIFSNINSHINSINNFGSDIWINILVDYISLRNYLSRNLPYKIPGLD